MTTKQYYKILKEILKAKYPESLKGVYKITNKKTGQFYIGSSNNIERRFLTHKHALKNKRHSNYKLTNDYKKHGIGLFSFETIWIAPHKEKRNVIYQKEQDFINELKPFYNIQLIVEIPNQKTSNKVIRLKEKKEVLNSYKPNIVKVKKKVKTITMFGMVERQFKRNKYKKKKAKVKTNVFEMSLKEREEMRAKKYPPKETIVSK